MNTEGFNLKGTLNAPQKHVNIPVTSKWLSGEGAGSWFHFEKDLDNFCITRFSPSGIIECKGVFKAEKKFSFTQEFELTYLSHCAEVNVIQNENKIKFTLQQMQE